MAKIHLIEGPVGAGKSTFAAKLSKELTAPSLILDAWFVGLYSPDRPVEGLMRWYAKRKERCLRQISATSLDILGAGHDVVLELGLVEAASRERFYALVESAGHELTIYLLDAPRDVRWQLVCQRNREGGRPMRWRFPPRSLSWRVITGNLSAKPSARGTTSE